MSSVLTLEAKLERTDGSTTWGFRMQGGKDFSSPLTIQRVDHGSLAQKCGLLMGDIILKIGNQNTDVLKHKDAKEVIIRSGNRLDLLLQRGGSGGYDRFNGPQINTNWNGSQSAPSPVSVPSPALSGHQNFNPAPRPFGGQAPPVVPSYMNNLSQQTQNMTISSAPKEEPAVQSVAPKEVPSFLKSTPRQAPSFLNTTPKKFQPFQSPAAKEVPKYENPVPKEVPSFQSATEKYSDHEEPAETAKHQSKSFKYLQGLMDEGKELNTALKPRNTPVAFSSPNKPEPAPVAAPIAAPIGPGSKPGTVKALVSQRYNNPLGLYSNENASTQLEGQSKFLVDSADGSGNTSSDDLPPPPPPLSGPPVANDGDYDEMGRKRYIPSQTFMAVQEEVGLAQKDGEPGPAHSRTFKMLQAHLHGGGPPPPAPVQSYKPSPSPSYQGQGSGVAAAPAAKAFAPAPVANNSPRPFGGAGAAPPKPTGKGATRAKAGEASMNQPLPATGRIPVCHSCNCPIRGPFVTALGNCWCPDHFVCANSGCGCKLLDIGFVEEGGYLYCERDYAQFFAPMCAKCGRAIIGECVNALEKSYHPECFLCAACNQTIGGSKFHIEDGKFYCEKDWAAMFQTMCAGCDFPIEPGDSWVEAMTRNFHSECFNCSTCQVNLEGQQFCAKGGKPYCKKHAR